jgi:DHA1 family tetracycline resistance protein-like MFS transporter
VHPRKPAIGFIFITLVLDVLGFGLLIPVAPRLVEQLLHGTGGEGQAARAFGWLAATYAAMQFLFSPALGLLSDRFGRRPVILVSLFGSALDYFAMALSPTLAILYFTRALNGLSGASMTVASAYVADVTPPEKRAAGFGMIGAAFGLGFVLGPLLGGVLGEVNIRLPFYAAGGLTLVNWCYGYFVLPESLPRERRGHFVLRKANPVGAFKNLGRYPLAAGLAVSFFLCNMAQFGLHATWVLSTKYRYGWTARDVGFSLCAVGIGAAVVQAGLARRLIPLLGEKRALMIGLTLAVLAFIGYGAVPQGWMVYLVIVVGSLAGIGQPAAQAIITKTVRPYEQGAIQGAMTSLSSIAAIIGPVLGANAFAYFISDRAPFMLPGAPFYVGAILTLLGLVVAAWAVLKLAPHAGHPVPPAPAAEGAAPIPETPARP